MKQLQEIENLLSKEFFKDVKKRFRRKARRSTIDPSSSTASWRRKSFSSATKNSAYYQNQQQESKTAPTTPSDRIVTSSSGTNKKDYNYQRQPLRSQSFSDQPRSRSLAESVTTPMNETASTFVGDDIDNDDIDGPFLESIEYDPDLSLPLPIIKPTIRKQLNLESYATDEKTKTPSGTAPPSTSKPPMQVKFSDSTHDVRSINSDANRSSAAASSVSASEALDFEFNMVIDIESGKCTSHFSGGGAPGSTDHCSVAASK